MVTGGNGGIGAGAFFPDQAYVDAGVELAEDATREADVVVWAAGIKAADINPSFGLPVNRINQFEVNAQLQTPADAVYAMGDLGRDLLNILDKLALGPVDLCGLSLGGMEGQWVALHAPQRLRRLVLANTTAYAGPPRVWEGRIKAVRHSGTAPIADAVIDSWFTPEFRARNPDAVAKVRAMVVATPASGYTGTSCGMRDMDFRPDLPRITTPTLVIVSEQDRATPPAWGEAVAAAIPAARPASVDAFMAGFLGPRFGPRALLNMLRMGA